MKINKGTISVSFVTDLTFVVKIKTLIIETMRCRPKVVSNATCPINSTEVIKRKK